MVVSCLPLAKRIMQDELTDEELLECLEIPNVLVHEKTILKLMERRICDPKVREKLLEYSEYMDTKFKLIAMYRLGHLAICALEQLGYEKEFLEVYRKLSEEDKKQVITLEEMFLSMEEERIAAMENGEQFG